MASAARRQIIGGGAPINQKRRRVPQIVGTRPVSRDRVSPLDVSPGDSISIQNLPRRICFGIDSPPGDYILKQSLRGRDYFILRRNKLSPGERLFRCELGYSHIAFIAKQSTLFWFTHLYPNYAL